MTASVRHHIIKTLLKLLMYTAPMLSKDDVRMLRSEVERDEDLPQLFNALSDVGRLRIFRLLMRNEDLCVTDIANILKTSVPAASQQLKVLELSGLVRREREGQMICYRVKTGDPLVKAVMRLVTREGE